MGFSKAFPEITFNDREFNIGTGLSWYEKGAINVSGWPNRIFMPLDLREYMNNLNSIGTYNIKIDTYRQQQ